MTSEVTPEYGAKFLRERTSSPGSFLDAIPEDAAEMAAAIEKFVRAELPGFTAGLKAHERGMMPKLLKKSGELGLLSIGIPEEYGGLQLPFTYQALIAEKTAINPPFSVSAGVTSCLATLPILLYGTEDQKQKWLPKLASGETLAAFALTEEEAGTAAFECKSSAVPSPDGGYLLNGTKMWISNGAFADLIVVFAQVPGSGLSAFLVEASQQGVSHGKEEHKIGLKGSSTTRLTFDGVLLPAEARLGQSGDGRTIAAGALNLSRVIVSANAVGLARESLALATAYANERKQGSSPIADFGIIRQKLGRAAAKLYSAETALYQLCSDIDALWSQDPVRAAHELAIECSLVKVLCSEVLSYVTDEAIQIMGGYGCCEEYAAAGMYRDARIYRVFYGTSEINRLQAVKLLLKPGSKTATGIAEQIAAEFAHGEDGSAHAMSTLEEISAMEPEVASSLGSARLSHCSAEYTRLATLCAAAVIRLVPNLNERQELTSALADMMIASLSSSAILARTGAAPRIDHTCASRWCGFTNSLDAWRNLQAILASRWHGPTEALHVRRWRDLFAAPTEDLFALELSLGAAVNAKSGFPAS